MAMAVQARYPSQGFIGFQSDVADHQQQHNQIGVPTTTTTNMVAGAGLTTDVSGARKRRRDEMCLQPESGIGAVSPSIDLQNVRSILVGEDDGSWMASSAMSTSGRPASFSSYLDQQAYEIDAVIRREIEMRIALVEMATRRYKRMLLVLGQRFQRLLNEMESKLALALKRNQELEQGLKQVEAETQLWMAHAKNNEAVAAALRASLDQVLHRSASATGDSPGCAPPAEDEWSSCDNGEEKATVSAGGVGGCGTCKSCGVAEVCMLVLPCRHLCLCEHCESFLGQCPVCNSVKNAGVRVFLS